MNETCGKMPQAPVQQLNDIASDIIDTLADAYCKAGIIKERLFINEPEKIGQANQGEPCNLESRLHLIRTIAREINDTLCMIQNRV